MAGKRSLKKKKKKPLKRIYQYIKVIPTGLFY